MLTDLVSIEAFAESIDKNIDRWSLPNVIFNKLQGSATALIVSEVRIIAFPMVDP